MRWFILLWGFRLFVGGILLASALGKSLDMLGFVEVLVTYRVFPDWSLWPIALLLTGIEWLLRRVLSAAVAMVFTAGRLGVGWHVLCVTEICNKQRGSLLTGFSNGRRGELRPIIHGSSRDRADRAAVIQVSR